MIIRVNFIYFNRLFIRSILKNYQIKNSQFNKSSFSDIIENY